MPYRGSDTVPKGLEGPSGLGHLDGDVSRELQVCALQRCELNAGVRQPAQNKLSTRSELEIEVF